MDEPVRKSQRKRIPSSKLSASSYSSDDDDNEDPTTTLLKMKSSPVKQISDELPGSSQGSTFQSSQSTSLPFSLSSEDDDDGSSSAVLSSPHLLSGLFNPRPMGAAATPSAAKFAEPSSADKVEAAEILQLLSKQHQPAITETHHEASPAKRRRGRPRKDGKPPMKREDKAAETLLLLLQQPRKNDDGGDKSTAKGNSKPAKGKTDGQSATRKSKRVAGEVSATDDTGGRKSARKSLPKSVARPDAVDKMKEAATKKMEAYSKKHDQEKATKKSRTAATNSDEKKRIDAAIKVVNAKYGDGEQRQKQLAKVTFRGVTCRPSGKWQAQVYYARKSRYIGVFESRENACLAYEVAREVLHAEDIDPDTEDKVKTASEIAIARKAAFAMISTYGSTTLTWRQLMM